MSHELRPWPWPFPQWDGQRWVMPLELAPEEVRVAASTPTDPMQEMYDLGEAPF